MSAVSPTPRQLALMRYVRGFQLAHGFTPSFAEIADGIGLKGRGAVHRLIVGAEERGHARSLPSRTRTLEILTPVPVPFAPDGAPLFAVPGPWDAAQ